MALCQTRRCSAKGAMGFGFVTTLLSIAMIASFLLAAGGLWMIFKGGDRKRGLLMIGVAAVTIGNVLILTLPGPGK